MTESNENVTLKELVADSTSDERRQARAMMAQLDRDEAARLRDEADALVARAQEALDAAIVRSNEIREEADALDPDGRAVAPKAAADVASEPCAKRGRRTHAKPERKSAKPRGKKETKRATAPRKTKRVSSSGTAPTEAALLKALGEPTSMAALAERFQRSRSLLIPLLRSMISAGSVKKTGEKRGTKYEAL